MRSFLRSKNLMYSTLLVRMVPLLSLRAGSKPSRSSCASRSGEYSYSSSSSSSSERVLDFLRASTRSVGTAFWSAVNLSLILLRYRCSITLWADLVRGRAAAACGPPLGPPLGPWGAPLARPLGAPFPGGPLGVASSRSDGWSSRHSRFTGIMLRSGSPNAL
ncbi:hypothetical protein CLUG_04930 [Clavispora lusitaniae ATCC 42720]|uniref:Uncharacterized protein n=1 Tax=Clavispora lusitaniae (strain ATCC 42720) TaxID=306902 RepID=C4Y9P0_CLAL4|nr:uncharacterized protein CLUG_04930 [Clavispora lusitaniae ATCC 42720]EEQ40802.1 hypothetical protein CLUG_04930 [Clavispora lusitaniae ATCC 42720]